MKMIRFIEVLVITLTLTLFVSNLYVCAAPPFGTSHEAPTIATHEEEEEESEPPVSSKPTSSKKPQSSKPPSSQASSSKKPSSSKESSSSKEPSSEKPASSSSRVTSSERTQTSQPTSSTSPSNQSDNSYLFSLRVVNRKDESIIYSLTPAFSKDTLSYSVSVPSDVTGVALYGTPEDSANARVEYHNMRELVEGTVNRLTVVCVAGNGNRRTYEILVSRGNVVSSDAGSVGSYSETSSGIISLPPVAVGDISSPFSSLTFAESENDSYVLLGIFAWVFMLGGLALLVLVILNSNSMKKSIGSSTVGAYTPSTRQNRMKKSRRKAKKRLLNSSYYSKYSRYKH